MDIIKDILGDKYELLSSFDTFSRYYKYIIRLKIDKSISTTITVPETWDDIDHVEMVKRAVDTFTLFLSSTEALIPKRQEPKKLRRVVAVDFDGTLCESDYPNIGTVWNKHMKTHEYVRKEKENGSVIILWTCRCGKELEEAVSACKDWHIPIDYVNENDPERTKYFGADSRKISADLYIDDRATNPEELEGGGY